MSGVYVIKGEPKLDDPDHDETKLVEMKEAPYVEERLLQMFLAKYPDLLAGDQINAIEPRRWLLIGREVGLPSDADGGDRWSMDHVFLDQDGIPNIVEVKRSSNTQIRREVVAQMLEYAANSETYLPVEKLRARFESECAIKDHDPNSIIAELVGVTRTADEFWETVKTNLQAGKMRLVFVADEIPPELKRIVEFLNQQMDPAELVALEIKQSIGEGLRTLVPRVVSVKSPPVADTGWTRPRFLECVRTKDGPQGTEAVGKILDWADKKRLRISWGRGSKYGSFVVMLDHQATRTTHHTFSVFVGPDQTYVQVNFAYMLKPGWPYSDEDKRRLLRTQLNEIKEVDIPFEAIGRNPNVPVSVLENPESLAQFLRVFDTYVDEIRLSNGAVQNES